MCISKKNSSKLSNQLIMPKKNSKTSGNNKKNVFEPAKRCQFTMPNEADELINNLVLKYQKLAAKTATEVIRVNRSRIVRAGLKLLESMEDEEFKEIIKNTDKLSEGRRRLEK